MSADIVIASSTQRILVDSATQSASVVLAGPQGPSGPPGEVTQADLDEAIAGVSAGEGADGASAYEVAVANGFVGTEGDWLASLVGPPGDDGLDGEPGIAGEDGGFLVNQTYDLEDSTNEHFAVVRIHHDGSSTSSWPNRFQFQMETGANTGVFRNTGGLNEYGEVRVSPARANTVALRVFQKELASDPARDMGVAIIEVMDNRTDRNILFQVMPDGTVVAPNIIDHHPTILDHDDSAAGISDGVIYFRTPAP